TKFIKLYGYMPLRKSKDLVERSVNTFSIMGKAVKFLIWLSKLVLMNLKVSTNLNSILEPGGFGWVWATDLYQ
ncbi:hypothetical protein ACUWC2_28905, partial [Klebsiella pneumoniae]|uniref:hypothetical protein n=1 Tax=Klebsiella pneumoniae TaxID=573 RepID=UPI00405599F8